MTTRRWKWSAAIVLAVGISPAWAGLSPAAADAPVRFSVSDASVVEGTGASVNATFTISLDNAALVPTAVSYALSNGNATSPSDFTYLSGNASFPVGTTTKAINVAITGDNRYEGNEYFTVSIFTALDAGIADSSGSITIIDDERPPYLAIGQTQILEGDSGSSNAVLPITLSNPSAQTVRVRYATSNGSAIAGSDFAYTKGTAVFAPGVTNVPVSVPVYGDTQFEGDEDFYLYLNTPVGAGITPGQQGRAYVRNDDDFGWLSVDDVRVTEGNTGSLNAGFVVRLTPALTHPVSVTFYTSDNNATAASGDYTPVNTVVSFAPGVTAQTVNVPVIGDTLDEAASESFYGNITGSTGASVIDGNGLGYIIDNDPSLSAVTPTLSLSEGSVLEGNTGTRNVNLTLRLSNTSASNVTVTYTTSDNSAVAVSDYTADTGTATITAGNLSTVIPILVKGDNIDENDESFYVNLSAPSGATISDGSAFVVIRDDDINPAMWINEASVVEGDSGNTNAIFTVELSAPSPNTVTVNYASFDNNAVNPGDYTAVSGPLTFNPGQVSKNISVPVKGDTTIEGDESYGINLSAPVNALITDGQAYGVIVNDDNSTVLSMADVLTYEGQTGSSKVKFTALLSAPQVNTAQVNWTTQDINATGGSDYVAASGTMVFAPGITSQSVLITVNGDTLLESNERFNLHLSAPANVSVPDPDAEATINDDDLNPGASVDDVQITEGDSGTSNEVFTVSLTGPSFNTVSVGYTTGDNNATLADGDYVAKSGTLTFAPGVTSQTVSVAVNGDGKPEANESFILYLNTPVNTFLLDNYGYGIIVNNDLVPYFGVSDVSVVEGNAGTKTVNFNVTLSSPSLVNTAVNYYTSDNSAVAGVDYVGIPSTVLTFAPGVVTQPVAVTINGDATGENDESFYFSLTNPVNAGVLRNSAFGIILDNDPDKAPSYLAVGAAVVDEGATGTTNATVTVKLLPAATSTVTVNYYSGDSSATAGTDYAAVNGSLTFTAGQTSQTITVPVNGDSIDENDEDFYVYLTGPLGATAIVTSGRVLIRDDDTAPWVTMSDVSVIEGNSGQATATVTIGLTAPATTPSTLDWSTADNNAVADNDYVPDSNTVSFAVGQQTKTVSTQVLSDFTNEGDETFRFDVGGLIGVQNAETSGTVVIRDIDTFKVTGTATNGLGAALAGVKITASGNNLPATSANSNAAGAWTLDNLPDGTYTLTPTKAATKFVPATATILIRGGDLISNNIFIGLTGNALGGLVTDSGGVGVPGATVTRTGNAQPSTPATTNALGYYGISANPAGVYTLTPTLATFTFVPASASATASATPSITNDFVALQGVTISGRITVLATSAPVVGATVTVTGSGQPTVVVKTNAQGYYGISNVFGPVGGKNYTLTPTMPATTFTPATRIANVTNTTGAGNQNFTT